VKAVETRRVGIPGAVAGSSRHDGWVDIARRGFWWTPKRKRNTGSAVAPTRKRGVVVTECLSVEVPGTEPQCSDAPRDEPHRNGGQGEDGTTASDQVTKMVGHADASWIISPRTAVTRESAAMQYYGRTHEERNVNPTPGFLESILWLSCVADCLLP
jgi:hypothetical protein